MSGELAGALRERVTIERRGGGRDGLAGAVGDWVPQGAVWAGVVPDGVDPAVAAGARDAMPRWTVTMRAGADVLPGDRLLWGDRVLMVAAVETWPDRMRVRTREQR
jgi:head-tail adaptor